VFHQFLHENIKDRLCFRLNHHYPPVPVPVVALEPVVTATPVPVVPTPVVPPAASLPAENLSELKLALDRVASLEQKTVVLESKLSSVEQKLSKVEAQLTTFINELSAPSPEEQEALPTSAGMVAVDEDLEEEMNHTL